MPGEIGTGTMFEICALLAAKKTYKARKASGPRVVVGARVTVHGNAGIAISRDTRYANAWFVTFENGITKSLSRDMLVVS